MMKLEDEVQLRCSILGHELHTIQTTKEALQKLEEFGLGFSPNFPSNLRANYAERVLDMVYKLSERYDIGEVLKLVKKHSLLYSEEKQS
ncbi:hypothetical protein GOV03_01630 [Candidatus Woesearchaeota archaeon]|nr:hypothetical protein [Candidatus Woesearchaeota archaeon]